MEAIARWQEGLQFEGRFSTGSAIAMDASKKEGGADKGPRPVELFVMALAGCSGMDVLAILKKKRVEVSAFQVSVHGEQQARAPKVFKKLHVVYDVTGQGVKLDAVQQAVHLTEKKYCSVSAMIRQAVEITSEIRIHEERS
jgi:putative redox protein